MKKYCSDKTIIEVLDCKKNARKDLEYGFDLSFNDFIKQMSILAPSTYGNRIQNKIKQDLLFSNSDDEDKGDFKNSNGEYFECKVSIVHDKSIMNIVQIRPWQDVSYIISASDISDLSNIKHFCFYLTANQMRDEIKLIGQSAHGTKLANKNNKNIEYAIRLKTNSNDFKRWIKNYNLNFEDLKFKLNIL